MPRYENVRVGIAVCPLLPILFQCKPALILALHHPSSRAEDKFNKLGRNRISILLGGSMGVLLEDYKLWGDAVNCLESRIRQLTAHFSAHLPTSAIIEKDFSHSVRLHLLGELTLPLQLPDSG